LKKTILIVVLLISLLVSVQIPTTASAQCSCSNCGRTPIEHKTLEAGSKEEIDTMITQHLREGWATNGSFSVVVVNNYRWIFYQGMVRFE